MSTVKRSFLDRKEMFRIEMLVGEKALRLELFCSRFIV
jgi:hypothetical protein